MDIIPNDKLTLDMLPGPEATEGDFVEFGHTFNGYEAVENCGEVANRAAHAFAAHAALPESLDELRACLFYEQRRNRHCGSEASEKDLRYYHALVAAMREIIAKRQAE